MKKMKLLLTLLLCVSFGQAIGQDYKELFKSSLHSKDVERQLEILEKWEKKGKGKKDAEYYIAYFNHYVNRGRNEIVTIVENAKRSDKIAIMSQDKDITEPIAYITGEIKYEPELISQAISWINQGIEKFPNRLDMRNGKTYLFSMIGDYENQTKSIIETVEYSVENNNKWLWEDDKPVKDAEKSMFSAIQDYQTRIYDLEDKGLYKYMQTIAETILRHYPEHVESLSNISIVYMELRNYDKALEYMLMAEEIDPRDVIVLSNIAHVYTMKGKIQSAIEYYQKMIRYGDDNMKSYAEECIKDLKK